MNNYREEFDNELYHYGVLGMKWGHRKAQASAAGHKVLSKVYALNERTYAKSNKTLSSMNAAAKTAQLKKAQQASDKAASLKKQIKERKKAINDTTNELIKNSSIRDHIRYNDVTRRKAAKYIVDNNMSVADATKKAQGIAKRNTAIYLGAMAGITITSLMSNY